MFDSFAAGDRSAVNPNIRGGVYSVALKQRSNPKAYESLLSFARETKIPDEYQAAIKGLGNTRDPEIVQLLLKLVLTDEIKAQDVRIHPTKSPLLIFS